MNGLLHEALTRAATNHPDRPAVVDGDREVSYAQLEGDANRVAHQLRELGVKPGDRVGLYLEKSVESLVALYGALRAGAAYVPLATEHPMARLRYLVRDAGIRVVLTSSERAPWWGELSAPDARLEQLVCLDGAAPAGMDSGGAEVVDAADVQRQPQDPPGCAVDCDGLAYVLYTSGSTGRPKGVMLTHRNALAFVDWAVRQFALRPDDRLSNHAPLHFDLAVFDVFGAAGAASTVVLVPRSIAPFPTEVVNLIHTQQVSVWYSVPSALNLLAARGELAGRPPQRLRLVLFAGEVFPVKQLRRVMQMLPKAEFYNLYGPTETNVCTYFKVPRPIPADCRSIPIGFPIDGVEVFARSGDGAAPPPGELGELWVRGPTLMRGYLGDDELTAGALDSSGPAGGAAYRTGDLGSRDEAGVWHFAGRGDSQIKSRGYRIELGEIEATLAGHPTVVECAVVAVPDPEFGNRIAAYVAGPPELTAQAVIAYARTVLPAYMVPWAVHLLDALPRTQTGKIDYQSLKASSRERTHVGRG